MRAIKKIKLTKKQILMLKLSDDDIKNGRLISQRQLDKEDMSVMELELSSKKNEARLDSAIAKLKQRKSFSKKRNQK